jgi:hypothetical protein
VATPVEPPIHDCLDAAAGRLEQRRDGQGGGRHHKGGLPLQELAQPEDHDGVAAAQQQGEQAVGQGAADDAVQVKQPMRRIAAPTATGSTTTQIAGAQSTKIGISSATGARTTGTASNIRAAAAHPQEPAMLRIPPHPAEQADRTERLLVAVRVALVAALVALVLAIAALAYVVSFEVIRAFAVETAAFPPSLAWSAPLLVDSFTTAVSLVILWRYLRGEGWRAAWYAWSLVGCATAVSVALNVAHAPGSAPRCSPPSPGRPPGGWSC